MKRFLLGLFIAFSVSYANAQSPVTTQPYPTTSISSNSSVIDTTNTFKTVFPASTTTTGRVDCLIQNLSTRPMVISFDTTPTVALSGMTLAALGSFGNIFRCANSGVVIRSKISITGTAGDSYFAIQE